jgi:hypothetical protein
MTARSTSLTTLIPIEEAGLGLQLNEFSPPTWLLPPKREWTKELYYEVAIA